MRQRLAIGATMIVLCAVRVSFAQSSNANSVAQLVASARAGTARYQNVSVAIGDGFKRVGTEFPAMGEHWVNLPRILENRFDAAQPSVLIYITKRGKRELAGVGYTALLGDGERPPKTAASLSDWHEHNGSVIDESLPVHGGASHSATHNALPPEAAELGATRLAILHAWVWEKNSAGTFVTENWTLPLVRAGVSTRPVNAAAVRGLSLANDSASYYEQTLNTALQLGDADSRRVHSIVDDARRSARAALQRDPAIRSDTALSAAWTSMWAALRSAFPTRMAELSRMHDRL